MTTPPVPRWQPRHPAAKPDERRDTPAATPQQRRAICGAVRICTRPPGHRGQHGGWRKVER